MWRKTEYQANQKTGVPTDATDILWDELYHFGMVNWVDTQTAKRLPNRTLAMPGETDRYLMSLDVFHQLHCLNILRRTLWPDRYKDQMFDYWTADGQRNYTSGQAKHYGKPPTIWGTPYCGTPEALMKQQTNGDWLDHCIENLRLAVMCHSDISVIFWDWEEEQGRPGPQEIEPHTCRNFKKIQEWALRHEVTHLSWPHGVKPAEEMYSVIDR